MCIVSWTSHCESSLQLQLDWDDVWSISTYNKFPDSAAAAAAAAGLGPTFQTVVLNFSLKTMRSNNTGIQFCSFEICKFFIHPKISEPPGMYQILWKLLCIQGCTWGKWPLLLAVDLVQSPKLPWEPAVIILIPPLIETKVKVLDILSRLIIAFQPRSLNPQAIDLSAVPLACSPPSLLTLRFIFLIVLHVSFHTCVFMTTLPCGLPFGDGLPDFSCFALVFKSGLHLSRCAHVPTASRSH